MLIEKSIYESWQRRFSYPLTSLEANARRELAKIKTVRSSSWKLIQQKAKQHRLVVLGDDALVTSQTDVFLDLLKKLTSVKENKVFITNRSLKNEKPLLQFLRKHQFKILTCAGTTFESQTKNMMKHIVRVERDTDKVIVWTGHLRLSSPVFKKFMIGLCPYYVYLQSNELRWNFPSKKGWVTFQDCAANLDASPLLSLSLYSAVDEKNSQVILPQDLEKTFHVMLKNIRHQLKQKKSSRPSKILHVFSREKIREISRTKNKKLLRFYKERVMAAESATMPKQKTVLLSSLMKSHLAEEAAHYLRLSSRKKMYFSNTAVIIEEALAFFASLLISPEREIPEKPKKMDVWEYVHYTGYSLGHRLHKAWSRSAKNKNKIRELWQHHPENETQAKMLLMQLMGIA